MQPAVSSALVFKFGLFEADVARNTLTRNGVRIRIQDQPFRVLLLLLDHPGEIVTRDELRHKLWPEGTYVDFDGSLNVILKKLRAAIDDDSDNPRFIETIPRRGYRFIAPVAMHGVKAATGLGDAELQSAPAGAGSAAFPPGVRATRRPVLLIYVLSSALLLLVIGAGSFTWHRKRSVTGSPNSFSQKTAPVPLRKSVAVLGFHNVSGKVDDAWLATAFSEMLSTELAGGEKLRLVSGEDVAHLRLSSPWSQTDTLDQETSGRIGTALNSDLLVLGSYTTLGRPERGQLRLDVRLQDARTGEILTEIAEIGGAQDLFRIVSRAGGKLRDRMGVPRLEESDEAGVLAALPSDREAARFYALGLVRLRQFDALAARDLLQQATRVEPKFSLAHAMLARAWSQLGYEQKRREEAKRALDLSADLPRADRMLVEGDYYESLADHDKAASAYHALFELFPDSVEYGLQLAAAQAPAHPSEALETLGRLRQLPPPASGDPRIDLAEAKMERKKPESLRLIRVALSKASSQGTRLVYAQARRDECIDLVYGEHPEEAIASCEDAYNIFIAAGNRLGAADSLRLIGDFQGDSGHVEDAIASYQRALTILRELGEHEKTGAVLNNMAGVFLNQGKIDRAEQLYREAKAHFEQAGDQYNTGTALGNIADVLYLRGDLAGAAKIYDQTIEMEASLDHGNPSYAMYRLADLELSQGQPETAQHHAEQAVNILRPEKGGYPYLTGAMIILGEAREAQGDLKGARQQFEEALAIRQKMGEAGLIAEAQVEFADLDLEEGHPEQAEGLLRSAIAEFEKEKEDPDATGAYVVLSRAMLMEGRLDDARQSAQRAMQLSLASTDPALKLPATIQSARVETASAGHSPSSNSVSAARQGLLSAVASARKLGYYRLECEARLALSEQELKSNPASGRAQLVALTSETRSRGLELLARQAERALATADSAMAANKSPR